MKKCISYWSFEHGISGTCPISDALAEAQANGFEGMELCISQNGNLNVNTTQFDCERIRECIDESGLIVETVASGMSWECNPVSENESVRNQALDQHIAALERTAWLGCQAYLYVPGVVGSPLSNDVVRYDFAIKRAKENIWRLLEVAENVNVDLCVENVWNGMFYSPLEFIDFIDQFQSQKIGIYFDVGNVLGYHQDPAYWIEMLGQRIKRVHIKDFQCSVGGMNGFCDLGAGDVPWTRVMNGLRNIGYQKTLVAEMLPWDPMLLQRTSTAFDWILNADRSVLTNAK